MGERQPELVGRALELAKVGALIERAADGEPVTAFVEGEAGIGKSRLLWEVAERVRERGGLVLAGSAPPTAGQPMPFAAVSQLLRDVFRQVPANERDELVAETPDLAHLQPGWRLAGSGPPPPTSLTAMCEHVLYAVDSLARARPVIALLLDDLQWADAATLDLVTYSACSAREARVFTVLAARLEEVALDAPIRRVRAELLRAGATIIALGPLAHEDAAQYLANVTGSRLTPRSRRRVVELGRGNPLFLRELAAGDAAAAPSDDAVMPETLVALVGARLAALPDSEREILRLIAVTGEGCTEDLVLRVSSRPEDATIEGLRRLVAGRLIVRLGDETVAVAHPLVREVVLGEVLEAQRRRIHSVVARVLSAAPEDQPGTEAERLIRIAEHWHAAGDRIRAFPALARAAGAAERSYAFSTAFDLYRKALEHVGAETLSGDRRLGFQPPPVETAMSDFRRRAAEAAMVAGEPAVALEWLDDALRNAGTLQVRKHLTLTRARALVALGDAREAVDTYRSVLERGPADDIASSSYVGFARALTSAGRAGDAIPVAETALMAARRNRSQTEEEAALLALGTALVRSGDLQTGVQRLRDARILRAQSPSQSAMRPRVSRVMDLTAGLADAARAVRGAGLEEEAQALSGEAVAAAARWGAEGEASRMRLAEAISSIDGGRWNDALAILDELVEQQGARFAALTRRARIAALRGAWDRAAEDLASCEDIAMVRAGPEDRAAFAIALTEFHRWQRQLDAATAAATEGLGLGHEAAPAERLELVLLAVGSHVEMALTARALRSGAEGDHHGELAQGLVDEAGRSAGEADARTSALVATARAEVGRLTTVPATAWTEARGAWEAAGSAWWATYAAFREGEAWLAGSAHRDTARKALVRAAAGAMALEAAPLLAEISALALRGRIELPSAAPLAPPPRLERKLPISDRELEVLVLLAKGLTNKEIASELFISERTAAHHVGHIFDKLGVSSRVEAAGMAHLAGVLGDTQSAALT